MSLRRRWTEWGTAAILQGLEKKLKTVSFENIGWEKGEIGLEGGNAQREAVE